MGITRALINTLEYDFHIQTKMIWKDSISRVDPYAIKEMEFNIKKSKKYTTCKSLIASLIVLALSVGISYSSIQNLWLDRSQLQITLIRKVASPNYILTESPVCMVNTNRSSTVIPRIYAYTEGAEKIIPLVDRFTVALKYPYMIPYLNTSYFDCVDLAGYSLRQFYDGAISISTDIPSTVYIKTISRKEIVQGDDPFIISMDIGVFQVQEIYLGVERYIYKDSLSINYQPQVRVGLSSEAFQIGNRLLYPGTPTIGHLLRIIDIKNGLFITNVKEFTIFRENIGQILGKFFAWYSLFLVIFVVAFGPIVEFTLSVELAKTLYTHQLLSSLQPSLFVQIKYYLAMCFSRCLSQRMISVAFQRLQKDMDIINMLKKQLMMRRISKQLRFSESRVQLFVPDFAQDHNMDKQLLQKEQEDNPSQDGDTQSQRKEPITQFIVETQEKPTFVLVSWLEKILCALDSSEVEIGLVYNNGNPHGSVWSLIVVAFGVAGMLSFIILTGVLSIQVDSSLYTQTANRNQIQNLTYTLKQNDIAFSIFHSFPKPWSDQIDYFQIIDSKFNVLKNLTMQRGQKCKNITESLNQTYDQNMYCLSEDITLYNDGRGNCNYLKFFIVQRSRFLPFFAQPFADVYSRRLLFVNDTYRFVNQSQAVNYNNWILRNLQFQKFSFEDQAKGIFDQGFSNFPTRDYPTIALNGADRGLAIGFQYQAQKLNIESSTIWDIIDNTWGVVVLAFQILILKVSKFINKTSKSSKTQTERQIQRGNVVNIMANYNRLIHGCFSNQLSAVKFYFKQNLSISEIKL